MEKLTKDAEKIMEERFGKDSVIALAITGMPRPALECWYIISV